MQTYNGKLKRANVKYVVGYCYNQDTEILNEFECPVSMIDTFYLGRYIAASRDDLVTHLDNIFNWHISNYEYKLKQDHTNEEIFFIKRDYKKLIEKREKIYGIILNKTA